MMNDFKICLVEDEDIIRITIADELADEGYEVISFSSGRECAEFLKNHTADIVVTDLRLPDMHGLELLKEIKKLHTNIGMLVMTAYGSVDTAIEAMKIGAFNYLMKPFPTEELKINIHKLIEFKNLRVRCQNINQVNQTKFSYDAYIGISSFVQELHRILPYAANTNSSVLVTGETGTGKELIANIIHYNSPRSEKPFVKVSCAILPREMFESELFGHIKGAFTGAVKDRIGKLEEANNGTLFLDDVDDIPLELQVKLLRFLQEGEIQRIGSNKTIKLNVKVIAATKKNLKDLSEQGLFREDLFYRLNVLPINLLAIRDRIEDVPVIFEYFVTKFTQRPVKISEEVNNILKQYNWKGNIREIKNIAERTVILMTENTITPEILPLEVTNPQPKISTIKLNKPLNEQLAEIEIKLITDALMEANNNKTKAAELLQIPLNTLRSKLEKYGIQS